MLMILCCSKKEYLFVFYLPEKEKGNSVIDTESGSTFCQKSYITHSVAAASQFRNAACWKGRQNIRMHSAVSYIKTVVK